MKLTNLFFGERPITEQSSISSDFSTNYRLAKMLREMMPGQTIQGEIVAKNGSDVQIKLLDDLLFHAKLEQNMNLEVGKNMSFEVKNGGSQIILSPLFANTATDMNVLKALDMAGLPVNAESTELTKQMMQAGLPIDRQSLQQAFRELESNAKAEVLDIVDLHKLGIEVNDSNIEQISNYRNLNHQLLQGLNEVTDSLPQVMAELANEEPAVAEQFIKDIIALLPETDEAIIKEDVSVMVEVNEQENSDTVSEEDGNAHVNNSTLTEDSAKGSAISGEKEADGDQTIKNSVSQMKPDNLAQLKELLENTPEEKKPEVLKNLLGDKNTEKLLTQALKKSFSLEPKDIAKENKVDEFYQTMNRQLRGLMNALETAKQTDTSMYKAVDNMRQNLDFMQQLNQVCEYVQFPLKLQGNEAHGELYVYSNKKNLAMKDGKISALLHLDMEHLGPVDVYVAMEAQKVNTNFYVADDAMLDFLNEHMDLLTARLQKRGYDISAHLMLREDAAKDGQGAIKPFLEQGGDSKPVMVSQYAFDVRA